MKISGFLSTPVKWKWKKENTRNRRNFKNREILTEKKKKRKKRKTGVCYRKFSVPYARQDKPDFTFHRFLVRDIRRA